MLESAAKHPGEIILAFGHKVSCIKVPAMGALAENGIEVDYRDPPSTILKTAPLQSSKSMQAREKYNSSPSTAFLLVF